MSIRKRGLGKGLDALLAVLPNSDVMTHTLDTDLDYVSVRSGTEAEDLNAKIGNSEPAGIPEGVLRRLSVDKIHPGPYQPRGAIKQEGIEQLAESIRTQGVIQPIVVRVASGNQFEIIAGERRWRAAQLAGLTEIPVLVKTVSNDVAMVIALIENIQREDLTPIEEAKALKRLSESLSLTHLQVAEMVGKSRASVTNLLRILSLNMDVQVLLEEGKIELGHAKALLALKGPIQNQVANTVAERGLSVRETEKIIARLQEQDQEEGGDPKKFLSVDPNIRRLQDDLADKLGAPVTIRHSNKGQGTLLIRYSHVDELEGILAHFK
jgi:ParB family chromosome partitioning protein